MTEGAPVREGVTAPEGSVLLYDGVGTLRRGDTLLVVYQKAARLERTRWLFDVADALLANTAADILAFMIVLPTADPPDARTRHENTLRMRRIAPRVRRLVTTPIGNAFNVSVVRTIMRGLNVLLGHADTRFVADTVQEGVRYLLEAKSDTTPSAQQILTDLAAIYQALGEPVPKFPIRRPGDSTPPPAG
jgi:hypothetical protein